MKFERYGWWKKKKLSKSWRRPRGLHNKMRRHIVAKGQLVKVGYRRKREERGLHPSGLREIIVFNTNDLNKVNPEGEAVRIASSVGRKKREEIEEKAAKLYLKVLNPS